MSKDFTDNVLTGKEGGYQIIYLARVKAFIKPGHVTQADHRWSSVATTGVPGWTGIDFFGGFLKGYSNILQSVDIRNGGNIGRVGDFTLTISNQADFSGSDSYDKFLRDTYEMEGGTIDFRVAFAGGGISPVPSWDDAGELFWGRIEKMTWDYQSIKFRCVDTRPHIHREISQKLITKEEFPSITIFARAQGRGFGKTEERPYKEEFSRFLEEGILGAPIPLHYGELGLDETGSIIETHDRFEDHVRPSSFARAIITRKGSPVDFPSDITIHDVALCGHDIIAHGNIYAFDGVGFVRVSEDQNDWSDEFENGILKINYRIQNNFVIGRSFIPNFSDSGGPIVDELAAIDEDPSNYTQFSNNSVATYYWGEKDTVNFPGVIGNWQGTAIFFYLDYDVTGVSSPDITLRIDIIDRITGAQIEGGEIRSNGNFTNNLQLFFVNGNDHPLEDLSIKFTYTGAPGAVFFIRNIYARANYLPQVIDSDYAFIPIAGKDWQHGNRAHISDNGLIKYAPYMIEDLLRDELGISEGNINTNDFDSIVLHACIAPPGTMSLAGSITETRNSKDIIREICKEFRLIEYVDYQGKHTVKVIREETYVSNLDFLRGTTQAEILEIIKADHDGSSLNVGYRIDRGELRDVYNEFILKYKKHPATGDYAGMYYMKEPGGGDSFLPDYSNIPDTNVSQFSLPVAGLWELCRDIYRFNGKYVNRLEIEADWIQDDNTAAHLIRWLIAFHAFRPQIVNILTHLETLDIEIGDIRDVSHPELNADKEGVSFMCIDWSQNSNNNTVATRWQEMPANTF